MTTRALPMNSNVPPMASLMSSSCDGHGYVPKKVMVVRLAPMWKCTGRCRSAQTSQSGSHARLARSGAPRSCGSEVRLTPRSPRPATRSASTHEAVDVPGRQDRHREQTVVRLLLDLGDGVVVDLDAEQAELGVLDHVGNTLAAEADGVREADLGVDARLVHDLDARLGVEGAEVDPVLGPLVQRFERTSLVAVAVDDPAAAGEAELGAVDHPHGPPVDHLDVGDPVLEFGRCARGPEVVGLGQMRVGINHPEAVQCQSQFPSQFVCRSTLRRKGDGITCRSSRSTVLVSPTK